MEEIIMALVVNGGNARSLTIEAIHSAKAGNFKETDKYLEECNEVLSVAHETQTDLIQKEAAGGRMEVQLLMVHAQDHLMNAMTVRDMAIEMIK